MLRTVIIGRTEREISNISHQIKEYLGDKLEVIGTSRTIKKGIILIKKDVPDLVILEIYKRKPFKFLEKFKAPYPFEIIITSSDMNNALEALRFGVFDYLVHPIGTKELVLSINRLEKKCKERSITGQSVQKELLIPTHQGFVMENVDSVLYFEGVINYSRIYLNTGRDYLVVKTLKDLEEIVGSSFYRIHKSYLVNVSQIKEYSKEDNPFILLRNGKKLAVSHRRKDKFAKEFLKIL